MKKLTRQEEREISLLREAKVPKKKILKKKKGRPLSRLGKLKELVAEGEQPYGLSSTSVALRYGRSRQTVERIWAREKGEDVILRPFQLQELFDKVRAPLARGESLEKRDRQLMEEYPPWLIRTLIDGVFIMLAPRVGRYKARSVTVVYGAKRTERVAVKRARRTVLSKLERYCTERLALDNLGLPHNAKIDALWNGLSKAQQDEHEARGAAAILGAVPHDAKERLALFSFAIAKRKHYVMSMDEMPSVKSMILCLVGALVLGLGLTWITKGNDFFLYKFFAPKEEQVHRETFEPCLYGSRTMTATCRSDRPSRALVLPLPPGETAVGGAVVRDAFPTRRSSRARRR